MGGLPPKKGYLETMRKLSKEHDVVLIFDEVVSGFHLAFGGAQEYFGITPYLAVFGKALGGLPLSAFGGRKEIMQFLEDVKVAHTGSYNANPLAMAASHVALREYQSKGGNVYRYLFRIGEKLMKGFRDAIQRCRRQRYCSRSRTTFPDFIYEQEKITNYREVVEVTR